MRKSIVSKGVPYRLMLALEKTANLSIIHLLHDAEVKGPLLYFQRFKKKKLKELTGSLLNIFFHQLSDN